MKFHVLTLFPEMILGALHTSIIGRAVNAGIISLNAVNIRDFSQDKHGKVDDYTYGGGAGMLMQAQPVYDAVKSVTGDRKVRTVYVTPQGRPFTQSMAHELATEDELVFLCGHYEGIDERVLEETVTDYISLGDYVLTGGELPAMVMIDVIARLVPGVLNNAESAHTESFHNDLLEYPQYSRPEVWHDKAVPEVLLSGNHKKVEEWRLEESVKRTAQRRPDLYAAYKTKQRAIEAIKKRKRLTIHMSESLKRGLADVLYLNLKDMLLYNEPMKLAMIHGEDPEKIDELLMKLPKETKTLVVAGDGAVEPAKAHFKPFSCEEVSQVLYTDKEPLRVSYKEIDGIGPEAYDYVKAVFPEEEEKYLKRLLEKGMLVGAYADGALVGIAGEHEDGRLGFLYVNEDMRHRKIGSSLTACMVNRMLQRGDIPYAQIPSDKSKELDGFFESMGFYTADAHVFRLFKA